MTKLHLWFGFLCHGRSSLLSKIRASTRTPKWTLRPSFVGKLAWAAARVSTRNSLFHRAWLVTEAGKSVSTRLGNSERFAPTDGNVDLGPDAIAALAKELIEAGNAALDLTKSLITR